ncbi:MAG: GAF domain-containing protein, partial [Chloroflexota bacterium]|nr:GAF domain-containing protein [Chloroflexota bacterium]
MRFTVRSLGGKLIIVAALTLLLCMLLFSALSLSLLNYLSEHDANSDASTHLSLIQRAYLKQSSLFLQDVAQMAQDSDLTTSMAQPAKTKSLPSFPPSSHLQETLTSIAPHHHLSLSPLGILSTNYNILGKLNTSETSVSADIKTLASKALQGKAVSSLTMITPEETTTPNTTSEASATTSSWALSVAAPIINTAHVPVGVVVAQQPIDDAFARNLIQETDLNILLCVSNHIQTTTSSRFSGLEKELCTPGVVNTIDTSQHDLTSATSFRAQNQLPGSPSLVVIDIEPHFNLNTSSERFFQLIIAIGIFVFALGVVFYTFVARYFLIKPLHRLQTRVQALVAMNSATELSPAKDELSMLDRSFNLLSESLSVQETESQLMTKQMRDLLIMSDALISTLNLEHLLGEIVSRLGCIMEEKNVTLLLYGREMLSPWAVAHWTDQYSSPYLPITHRLQQPGAITVHSDPDGDITLAATTKMVALPGPRSSSSGKRKALGVPKLPSHPLQPPSSPYGLRRPRIPRPALRDLDMILARMAMQKQKIVYGEDVATISSERRETWAYMALENGYRSVIAVPLLLQDQPIGAFILYDDKARQVTSRDTFLLSTAAIQASMAIQNAL